MITIEDFGRLDLRVAVVTSAQRVEGAKKLLRLTVDVGEAEQRQLVAGIAEQYEPADLVGRQIVVLANLKPATIRGLESRGMLLAAERGERVRLLTVDGDVGAGAKVA
jgi:methionine--tRNA ligase beta chain